MPPCPSVPSEATPRSIKALAAAKAREAEDTQRRAAEEKAREEDRERRRAEIEAIRGVQTSPGTLDVLTKNFLGNGRTTDVAETNKENVHK